jgi:CDP-diacylglycerol--glycerol-3-phosphate 3-phosphatidyltransferase
VATGHLHIAIILLILTGLHDLLDGPVAKAAGTASVRGAFFDSVTDRVADAVLMGGVAWYLIGRHEGHLALLPLAVLGSPRWSPTSGPRPSRWGCRPRAA